MKGREQEQDRELLERVRGSDREALGELFAAYQPMLFRQLVSQTGRPELAHDIVQEPARWCCGQLSRTGQAKPSNTRGTTSTSPRPFT